jgi:WD40 repeat protein
MWTCDWEDLPNLPADQKNYSPDKKRLVVWFVARHREDRFDDDTDYEIAVWDVDQKKRIAKFMRFHKISNSSGNERGAPIDSVAFSPDGSEVIIVQDGKEQREKLTV